MADRSFFAPFGDVLAMLTGRTAVLYLAVMVAAQLIGNAAVAAVSGPFPLGGHAMVPVVLSATQAVKFAVFIGVFFLLSRRLGGPDGTAGTPNLLVWLGLMITYFAVTKAASMVPGLLPDIGQMGPRRMPAVQSAISFGVRMLFFPIMVFIAASVHRRGAVGFSQVWKFLTTRGIGWYLCFALFGLVYAAALFAMPLGLGTASGVPPRGALFVIALVGVAGQLIGMLFAIAAYRDMYRESGLRGAQI